MAIYGAYIICIIIICLFMESNAKCESMSGGPAKKKECDAMDECKWVINPMDKTGKCEAKAIPGPHVKAKTISVLPIGATTKGAAKKKAAKTTHPAGRIISRHVKKSKPAAAGAKKKAASVTPEIKARKIAPKKQTVSVTTPEIKARKEYIEMLANYYYDAEIEDARRERVDRLLKEERRSVKSAKEELMDIMYYDDDIDDEIDD